jgi:DNA-binding MurR/RpiR family transcriptional regulator
MGRTVVPFSQVLEAEFESWSKFRRALRREDQEALDALFAAAKYHVAAMVYASRLTPLEAILMGILVEHQKAITQMKGQIRELEAATGRQIPNDK